MREETPGRTPAALDQLSPAQKAALLRHLAQKRAAAAAEDTIPRRTGDGPLPLSFAQQRLWLVDRLEPGSAAYNMPFALRLTGALDSQALRRSLDALVRRHETLRTVFGERDGAPVQVVRDAASVPLPAVDLRRLADPEGEAARLAGEEALRPFDLERGPLLRSTLLRLADDEHLLCFTLHHIVSDGWSLGVLVREVSALYDVLGGEGALPALPVQYADYALWQRARLADETMETQLAFWSERLRGAPPLLDLPVDRPRAAGQGTRAGTHAFVLPAPLSRELRALSRREGTTPFMTILAAWQAVLGRWAGQDDVVVGSPVAGRTRAELEGLIGFFVNMLALRADLGGDPTWRELLTRVRETALAAYSHQDLPFERVVEALAAERSLLHAPLFQVIFTLQPPAGRDPLRLRGLEVEPYESREAIAKFDLDLAVVDAGEDEAMPGSLAYRSALFDPETAERLTGHLEAALEALTTGPGLRFREMSLLRAGERTQVLQGWNATAAAYPQGAVHRLFEAQAARTPDAVALVAGAERLSYAELEARANRLAHHLRARGVGPDARVALCAERSVEMLVGVLGILKAGGAYVPLDPAYPAERLAYMLADSGAKVLLTQAHLVERLPWSGEAPVRLDADREAIERESADAPGVEVEGEHLCYVIYTSGSTGRPKGVAMPHAPLVNLLAWQRRDWRASGAAVTLHFATISFDASFHEIFSCWAEGGRLVLADEAVRQDPGAVLALVEREGVERLFLPYVAVQRVAEEGQERGIYPATLREVQTAGEALRVTESIRGWLGALGAPLYNHYGPSETHVVTSHTLEGDVDAWPLLPSIGGPIANTRCYVLDGELEPTPVGVPGELYLGGECLARGYLGRPELTAERFVPDANGDRGGRMYRTGDRVRWRATGELEFLGRVDAQVKVRGYRVEPGEVEAVLEGHAGVKEAVVVVREDVPGVARLVGYVVPEGEAAPTAAELRAYLGGRLPEYMVPGAYVVLEALPLTPSGKTDRRALPAPEGGVGGESVAPRTPTEEVVAGIWGEVLGVEGVGVEESFFELGGHSLLATQVVSRVRRAFGVEVPVRSLFETPTVAALAARVEEARREGRDAAPPVEPVARDGEIPLSFSQQRLWIVDRLEPGSAAFNMPYALRLRGALDVAALRRSLDALVRRHEALRTTIEERAGVPVQVIHPPAPAAIPVVDLRGLPDTLTAARRRVEEEALRPFDLSRGPLLRSTLLRLDDEDHVLCFTLHHVVGDGWSMEVLVRDASALYAAFSRGEEPRLPALPVQYADFAVWQRARLAGEALKEQLRYWKASLSGAPPLLEIPLDRPRAAGQDARAASHPFILPAGLSNSLRSLSRREGATLFMTLLAGWGALLGRWAGQDDVVVGSPVAGRTRAELEGLIGFFVNMLALRTELGGDPTWRELLSRVREMSLGAYAHQELPFERLVEALEAGRDPLHAPVFQVAFALERITARSERLSLGDVEQEPFEEVDGAAKFDLYLPMTDAGEALTGALVYRRALFDAETVGRLAGHLEAVLEVLAADPERRVSEVSLLRGAERAQVLEGWSVGPATAVSSDFVHELIARQAGCTPDAVAVVDGAKALTYAALEARVNGLATRLRMRGVGPEMRVGICLDRTVEQVVAVLGVLKAGGAYVPLDPAYPAARLAYVLLDSGADLLVTSSALRGSLPEYGEKVVCLDVGDVDGEGSVASEDMVEEPARDVESRNAAYVIYTSGSTGEPKGVVVEHGSLAGFVEVVGERFGPGAGEVALGVSSFAFDIWAFEVLAPLARGATVRLLPLERVRDAGAVAEELESAGVLHAVPALMRAVVEAVRARGEGAGAGVRRVYVGGEAVPGELLGQMGEVFPGAAVRVLYGPTETTVLAASHAVTGSVGAQMVGRPLGNVRLYVCDAGGQAQPAGVPGELWIGGAGLARGYLGRPELTAERFVPDALSEKAGARLYRTGDRVRWLADGELEYLGRVDDQVKVRGFRIEPGEVEAALVGAGGVREAVVVAREDAPGERRLVAYVVPEKERRVELWPSIGEYFVYDELIYQGLTHDAGRNARYLRALERHARGKVVLDVGTGADAILARLAVEAGARHVYAVELLERSYLSARARIRELGLEDRVTVIHGDARTVQLPEPADVCVSEIVEAIAGGEGAALILDQARGLLAPGAVMIPGRAETRMAAVTLPDEVVREPAFSRTAAHYVRRIFDEVGHPFDLRLCIRNFPAGNVLTTAGTFEDLDFAAGSAPSEYVRREELVVEKAGRLDGLLLWLRMELAEGEVLDILEEETAWFPVYFPLFDPGIPVAPGDRLRVECRAELPAGGVAPDYGASGVLVRRGTGEEVSFSFVSTHHGDQHRASPLYRSLFADGGMRIRPEVEGNLGDLLREHLRARLPEHMVPGAYVVLDRLPLNANGKVDRRALPAPERAVDEAAYVAPRTPVEEVLSGIWAEVLGVERVGADSHFFELGGHSLLATQVIARVRRALGVEVPVRALFEGPTVASLAARVEALRNSGTARVGPPLIRANRVGGALPVSFAQERLWVVDRLDPGTPTYNMPFALRLRGALDVDALSRSLDTLVLRHEALRTVFREQGGAPVQVVLDAAPVPLPVVDLRDAVEPDAEGARLAAEDALRPFDLSRGPLLRSALLRLGEADHVLCFTVHHIVSDGWSTGVLVREVSALYGACSEGKASPLPELPVQYADYAMWQRAWLSGDVLEAELGYWRDRLSGAPPLLEIPLDRPRAAGQSAQAGSHAFTLSAEVSRGLRALSRREGTTLFMTVLAGWAALLGRWSGQEDVVVGTPVAGRTQVEVEGLIGFFVNLLALRTELGGDPTWREVLGRVRETALGAYAHQALPFERLVDEVVRERSLEHAPLFQVMFAVRPAGGDDSPRLSGVEVEPFGAGAEVAQFDLDLTVAEGEEQLSGALTYRRALFDAETMARLAGHLEAVLEALAGDPDGRVSDLSLLRGAERTQVLEGWSLGPATDVSSDFVHELIARQAARTPDAVAVVGGAEALTYAALEARANRLAARLRAQGVGPEMRVGICLDRTVEQVEAVLGVLKAGGAYVPLDPAYPAARLAYVLSDSGADLVVTRSALRGALPEYSGAVVCLDVGDGEPERVEGPVRDVESRNAAYVIYTSGSTGEPKGVVVEHGSLAGFVEVVGESFGPGAGEVVLGVSSFAFDIWAFEVLAPLARGATVRLLPLERVRDAGAVAEELESAGVLHAVPALMRAVVEAVRARGEGTGAGVRRVYVGGEAVPGELLGQMEEVFPGAAVRVLYGPTETTVLAASHAVSGPVGAQMVGRPLGNARLYVCDAGGQAQPAGVPGELWIGGAGLARGYLGRPELTAERFVPDALSGEAGARLYRTGDRVRWLASGELEYLGRVDDQVKVRGYRIEPGEVEAALVGAGGVREAVVVAREDVPGERRLVAYVVAEAGGEPSTEGLRDALRERLPEHMVPSAIVWLERLPLNANGKVDRRALPAPERAVDEAAYVAPRTAEEEVIAGIWAEVLRLDRVGVEEGFFELGGDSILAIQVVSRARERGLRLSPRQVFEHPTVARLARVVEAVRTEGEADEQGAVTGESPLTPIQRRFFEQDQPSPHHYNQALLLVPRERLDGGLLSRAVARVVEHHDALRLRFRRDGAGEWRQAHAAPGGRAPVIFVDLSALAEDAQGRAIEAAATEVQGSLDLSGGPLLRVARFELGAGRGERLLVAIHHLAVDGVSWRILLEDVERAYVQLGRGEAVWLPAKTTSWKAWAAGLEARVATLPDAEVAYWRTLARKDTAPLAADYAAGENTVARGRSVSLSLGEVETEALLREVPQAYRTQIDDVLLTALARTLARWTGGHRFRVELEGHGREEASVPGADLSRTVGWFTTIYPVVLEVPSEGGEGAALKAVKEQVRSVPSKGIGYGLLRYLGGAEVRAELEAARPAEVVFNYLGQLDGAVSDESFFSFAPESAGASQAPDSPRGHLLEVSGAVREGRLEVAFGYAEGVHHRETIERVAGWFGEELRALIARARGDNAGAYTPSDFPLAGLDPEALDALLRGMRDVEDVYPLTPLQEGMLFDALYAPGAGVYVGQFGFVLEGDLDPDALERAWRDSVARHDALRAGFAWDGLRRPLQVVRRSLDLPFRREDWRRLEAAERDARLDAYLAADREEGFDLGRPPLMRLALFRTGEREHQLVWTHHHLILDGWSLSVLFRDVLALYDAHARGGRAELRDARPFREHVAWLERRDRDGAEAFWQEALAGFDSPTPLPVRRPAAEGSAGYGDVRLHLPAERTRRLLDRARAWGVTPGTLVQGAWAILLARESGEDDVLFGATVSGRPAEVAGADGMVGLFINTLPVRVRMDEGAMLRTWLQRLQEGQARAREHAHAPLVEVRKWSDVPAGEPLFESLVVFENYPVDQALGDGGEGLRIHLNLGIEQTGYPLVLSAEVGTEFRAELRFDRSRIDPDVAERMVGHLDAVLEAVVGDPGKRLHQVSLMGEAERVQVVESWNTTAADFPRTCVHERIAAWAARTPAAVAVEFEGRSLTYAELDSRSNRLARHLRSLGAGPERIVGMYLERGMDAVVAVLGILKAGAAWLPLDPATPPERVAHILHAAAAPILLTEARFLETLPPGGYRALALDADRERIAAESDSGLPAYAEPRNAAFVLYTSGSTGTPKGVVVEHRSLANQAETSVRSYALAPGDRVLQFASLSFDTSVEEIVATLLSGATLVVRTGEMIAGIPTFLERCEAWGITVLDLPTAFWHEIVADMEVGAAELPPCVRLVVIGGESALPERVAAWRERMGGRVRLLNTYGPTEATVFSTLADLAGGGPSVAGTPLAPVSIGRPVPNTRAYVLDAGAEPLPVGVPGELYLGGAGVARGYLGRAALTAERFVPDGLSGNAGARLYRTGDRVRWFADGELEYLGRMDQQVKVRGFRIEPGEIEAVLRGHPGVREAAVVAREHGAGELRLVAYVVADGEVPVGELREHLQSRLPEYMVPSAFVVLDRLPMTVSGKVDRRALPAPRWGGEMGASAAPRTPAEEMLGGIWAEVLGIEGVGADAHFFELGGHSLLATQVVSRVRRAFGVELPLRTLFEAPTLSVLAGRIEALRSAEGAGSAPPLERVSREEAPPLSFAQQRLWLVDRLEPGSAAYNMPFALRLRGALDVGALRRSLDGLVRRHEALRTTFAEREGGPVQMVHPPVPAPLGMVDLRGVAEPEAAAERLASQEALRPFDLERGPLLRSTLLRLSETDHVLCFTLHHVVSDGWSMDVLVREVSELYAAACEGRDPTLPELPVQYADYSVWQRNWLSGETLEREIGYWRDRLTGAPPLLEIPMDRPRAAGQSARAGSHAFTLTAEVSQGLRALSRREGTTLFMTVLSGWAALLGRWSGQEDMVVGTPVAGRTQVEVEGLIGFFVNLLALRTELGGEPTWREVLGRVRETALGAYAHQALPFERLVEELEVPRSLTHTPVFQTTFALERAERSSEGLALGEMGLEPFGSGEVVGKFELELVVEEGGEALSGVLLYRRALYSADTAARLVAHLENVLETLVADPGLRISDLSLLRGAERAQVLEGWSLGPATDVSHDCVHEMFAAQVARTPGATAVVAGGRTLTYAELERSAGRLAHHLRILGVGPETRVAVCAERSAELVVALLAVLSAGGAYVPVDPDTPAARIADVLADSGAAVLLTQTPLLERLPVWEGAVICLDRDPADEPAGSGAPQLPAAESPENAAYVIYTSGSTGRPKGVVVPHGALSNHMEWMQSAFPLTPGDRVLQKTSIGFDASVWEFWAPLLAGATLVMAEPGAHREPARLAQALREEGITVAQFVPSVLPVLLEEEALEDVSTVRRVFCGGEALSAELATRVRDAFGAEVVNLYGPTEACIDATASARMAGEGDGATVPIGRPVRNVRAYVVDAGGAPLPVGVPGELCLGGAGLARGYLGRADLTAERFVPDGHSGDAGARLYRTGDRVRWLASGELEYLGRMDQQVKVRGFRIEPGEIEAVLRGHPRVREAAVVAREHGPGELRLVAYVVADGEIPVGELREHLRGRLPEYMVPSAFVPLDRLPLTASGKLDRRALPAPRWGGEASASTAPRTPTEELLGGIWTEVLGIEGVGPDVHFFELGGHSLLATQVVSRVRRAFGVELPLRALFEAPTLSALAGRIEALRREEGAGAAPPLERISRAGDPPLSFAQQRLWLVDRLEPGSAAYNMPFALRLRGGLDVGALRRSLDALVRRHEALRTTFEEHEGGPVQVVHSPSPVRLGLVDLRGVAEPEAAAERLAEAEAMRPFDLERGPLLRSTLLRLSETDHVLCFTLHHVVSDGWSMDVLVREVSALYATSCEGRDPALPELPVQYADYAVWQRNWLSGETLEQEIGYWRERLAGAPPLLEIPLDRPRAAVQSARAGSHAFTLSEEVSRGLRALSRREGTTLFMTLLSGWAALLGRWSGQEEVVVGTPVAGRTQVEVEGLIGFFVNLLALRTELGGEPTWREVLGRVRETALGAYAHQALPFERLVEELEVPRSLTHTPVFQTTFALERAARPGEGLALGEVGLEPFGAGEVVGKFEMELVVEEGDEALSGVLLYRRALYSAETMARLVAQLETVLEALVADPGRHVSDLSLLRGAERAQVLEGWSLGPPADVSYGCLHEMFAVQAARTPGATAVVSGGRTLSYAELERAADRLARHLRAMGVGPETRVAVCAERSAELVVALLAVLKAGGAYVPVDPDTPTARMADVLTDSGAAVLLTQTPLLERLPSWEGAVVCLDRDPAAEPAGSAPLLLAAVSPENAAYVIYTSGSTGRPKGVVVPHGALSNHMEWMQSAFPLSPGDRVLQKTSIGFDASVWEFWAPLLAGATLVMAEPGAHREPARLAQALREEGITVAQFVPSVLPVLLEEELADVSTVRRVFCGGEALPAELAARVRDALGAEVVNLYGPTEACIDATASVAGESGGATVPIGRPIHNVRAYVLDAGGAPLPVGVPGELYLGGAGLARGYLGRADLTAERFVPDGLSGDAGERLYRTGDRVRWLAQGELEYLGRMDQQVKVRGFRIEPGEIEAVLRGHPGVREAAVVAREHGAGELRLVAYVVADGEIPSGELREHLRGRLPEYMVPSAFVPLDRLPLTASGKLDRRALPAPERASGGAGYVAPRTDSEASLAAIFAEVLGLERVGVEDDFFELGGHSLLATRVVSGVRAAFGLELPLRAVFEAPTVAALAAGIDAAESERLDRLTGDLEGMDEYDLEALLDDLEATSLDYGDD